MCSACGIELACNPPWGREAGATSEAPKGLPDEADPRQGTRAREPAGEADGGDGRVVLGRDGTG